MAKPTPSSPGAVSLNIVFAHLRFVVRGKLFFSTVEKLAIVTSVAAPGGFVVPTDSAWLGCHRAIHVNIWYLSFETRGGEYWNITLLANDQL
jgi:hypothetical protein